MTYVTSLHNALTSPRPADKLLLKTPFAFLRLPKVIPQCLPLQNVVSAALSHRCQRALGPKVCLQPLMRLETALISVCLQFGVGGATPLLREEQQAHHSSKAQRLVAQVKAAAVRLLSFDEDCLLPFSWEVAYTLPCVRSVNLTKTSSESLCTLATKLKTDMLAGWRGGSSTSRAGEDTAAREQHWPHGRRLCRTGAALAAREQHLPHGLPVQHTTDSLLSR